MNIDLLFTAEGDAGLIASENFFQKIIGVIYDSESGLMSVEFMDGELLETNIPVEGEYNQTLDMCPHIHIGAVKEGNIAQAYQVPFMISNDPYRTEVFRGAPRMDDSLQAFSYFVKQAVFGQPVHRDELGDESAMGCILGDASPSALQFAPHLARRIALEARLQAQPSGPSGPGLGGGGSAGGGQVQSGTPPQDGRSDKN